MDDLSCLIHSQNSSGYTHGETKTRFEKLEKMNEEVWAELLRCRQHKNKVGRIVVLKEKFDSLASMVTMVVKGKTVEMEGEQAEALPCWVQPFGAAASSDQHLRCIYSGAADHIACNR